RGSSLFFLYDGNAETMDEFDGATGEWARWSLGHNDDGLLPNLSGLRGQKRRVQFAPELITVFAVSIGDNSLWSLDVFDLFWRRLGDITQNGTPAEIVSANGRIVFVRAGEETVAVTVAPDYAFFREEDNSELNGESMEMEEEEMKQLRVQLAEARGKRDSQLSKLRKIGVMLLETGADQSTLEAIETGLERGGEKGEEDEDPREKMRREIETIEKSQPLYKKKLIKYMVMIAHNDQKKEKEREEESGHMGVDHAEIKDETIEEKAETTVEKNTVEEPAEEDTTVEETVVDETIVNEVTVDATMKEEVTVDATMKEEVTVDQWAWCLT
ncbi:hypothetical protein PENTCL1PPCAC_27722, partial [Pristionchus entomophagus]